MKATGWILGVAALGVAAFAVARGATNGVTVGAAAPAFEATDSNGKPIKLSDYSGKYVVLEWSNFGCPYVQKHYNSGNMQALQKKYTGKGVEWLTVFSSAEGRQGSYAAEKLNKLAKEKHMASSELIIDSQGKLGRLYGATNTPDMVVIDPSGNVIYSGAIDNMPTPDPEDIKTAKNYVAAALDEAMAGRPVSVKTSRPYGCAIKYSRD